MYPDEDNHPATAETGDRIEHKLIPGFTMPVLEAKDCETDSARPDAHRQYRVIDPEGNEDWVCGYDVRTVHQ